MSCGQNCGPQPWSPEYNKRFKPESNDGCGCGGDKSCDAPSNAVEGTPRWEWEQIYGKLVTYFHKEADVYGHTYYRIERLPCPPESNRTRRKDCCSLRYKVLR